MVAFSLLSLVATVTAQAAWPDNIKKGCVLKNKRSNYEELTKSCSDAEKLEHCSADGDPSACASCANYDEAAKVSYFFLITLPVLLLSPQLQCKTTRTKPIVSPVPRYKFRHTRTANPGALSPVLRGFVLELFMGLCLLFSFFFPYFLWMS